MNDQKLYQYIEDYTTGKLTPEDSTIFKKRLENDKDFKELYRDYKITEKLIDINYANHLSTTIKKVKTSKNKKATLKKIGVMGVLLVGGIGGIFIHSRNQRKEQNTNLLGEKPQLKTEQPSTLIEDEQKKGKLTKKKSGEKITNHVVNPENSLIKNTSTDINQTTKEINTATQTKDSSLKETESIVDQTTKELTENKTTKNTLPTATNEASKISKNQTEEKDLEQSIDCSSLDKLSVTIEDVHLGESDGQIKIEQKEDITYRINSYDSFVEQNEFFDLEKGNYQISVKWKDYCTKDLGVFKILEKPCRLNTSLIFNMNYDNELTIPLFKSETIRIKLLDSMGKLVLTKEILDQNEFLWDGTLDNGSKAGLGSYILRIKGNKNEFCEYFIVVAE